jgi:DNA-directed RNA polymerase specialized sigma24 family protein
MSLEGHPSSIFPRTDWSELGKAAGADEARLDWLIRQYQGPLKVFLEATFPALRGQADEILQDFAQDRMLREGWLGRADRSRGQFREFLKFSLRNFALDRLRRAEARRPLVPIEAVAEEALAVEAASEQFDTSWLQTVLAETLRRMETDCKDPARDQPRRGQIWEMFRLRLLEPILNGADQMPYDQLTERFGLKSPLEASNTLLSAKRIFKAHLADVIHEYSVEDSATAVEIQALEDFISRLAARN